MLVLAQDVVVKIPNWEFCQTVDRDSWAWWTHGCWWFDLMPVMVGCLPALMVGVMLLSLRQVQR